MAKEGDFPLSPLQGARFWLQFDIMPQVYWDLLNGAAGYQNFSCTSSLRLPHHDSSAIKVLPSLMSQASPKYPSSDSCCRPRFRRYVQPLLPRKVLL